MFDWLNDIGSFLTDKNVFPSLVSGGASLANNLLDLSVTGDKEADAAAIAASNQSFEASEAEKNRQNQLEQIRLSAALKGGGGNDQALAAQIAREKIKAEMAQAVMQSIMQGGANTADAYGTFINGINNALRPIR